MPTVPTFAVRETDVSRHNGGTSGAPLKPLRYDSALRALTSLRGLSRERRYAERRQSLGQQMLERWAKIGCEIVTVGKNGLRQLRASNYRREVCCYFGQIVAKLSLGKSEFNIMFS